MFQEYLIRSYLTVEASDLTYIRFNQKKMKVENYSKLKTNLERQANERSADIGRKIVLPSTFQGSERNMRQRYHDAMAIVVKKGKPDLFITFTCNPNWKEIKENLYPGQEAYNRPDITARVFKIYLKQFLRDIIEG